MPSPLRLGLTAAALLGPLATARPVDDALPAARRVPPQPGLGGQLAASSGGDLTSAQCDQRLTELGALLARGGYRSRGTLTLEDGTRITLWSHPGRRTTALVLTGTDHGSGYVHAGEVAGILRWNEVRALP